MSEVYGTQSSEAVIYSFIIYLPVFQHFCPHISPVFSDPLSVLIKFIFVVSRYFFHSNVSLFRSSPALFSYPATPPVTPSSSYFHLSSFIHFHTHQITTFNFCISSSTARFLPTLLTYGHFLTRPLSTFQHLFPHISPVFSLPLASTSNHNFHYSISSSIAGCLSTMLSYSHFLTRCLCTFQHLCPHISPPFSHLP